MHFGMHVANKNCRKREEKQIKAKQNYFSTFTIHSLKSIKSLILLALPGVAQEIRHWPVNQRVTCSILSQGTCLGCGPGSQLGACERQPMDVSLVQ